MGVQKWGKEDTTTLRKIVFNWGNRKRVDRVVKHSNHHHLEDYSKIALLYILLFIITQFLLPPYKKGTCFSTFLMYFTFQMNVWLPLSNGADYSTNEKFYIYLIPSSNCAGMHAPNVKYCQLRESLANCLAIRDETCTKIQQFIPLAWFFPRNRSSWNSFSPKISPPFLSTTYQSD